MGADWTPAPTPFGLTEAIRAALDTVRTAEDHVNTPITARPAGLGLLGVVVALLLALLGMTRVAPGTTVEAPVRHRLSVLALDGSSRESATSAHSFSYRDAPRAYGLRFALAGDVSDLAPGLWREVPVRVSNPNGVPIRLSGLTLTMSPDSTPSGCLTATNLEVRQPGFVTGLVVPVPPRAMVTLPTEGVSAASIRLRNLPNVNQDVCKNKAFTLMWSAAAEQ